MLQYTAHGDRGPLLVLLHWLTGSANTWTEVAKPLASTGFRCVALDLPGFGRESLSPPQTSAETCEDIIKTIQSLRPHDDQPWLLVGHSMGGKFAAIVARAAADGRAGLANLSGLILVSPSPPGPEPMSEKTRQQNIEAFGASNRNPDENRRRAESFLTDNTGKLPLGDEARTRAAEDILRMNRTAFVAWMTTGSEEDWSSRIGQLPLPTLILAGSEESALHPESQREHTLPHFPNATLSSLNGGGHLAPLERPAELAQRIILFVRSLGLPLPSPALSSEFQSLIESSRTSPQTRAVLMSRLADDHAPTAGILTTDELLTLNAVAARILPRCPFDLAARIDRWLALPHHNGWRHDTLPPDVQAWQTGLQTLSAASITTHAVPFVALDSARQDVLLEQAREGKLHRSLTDTLHLSDEPPLFSAAQMHDWFGDLHAELVKIYIADPRTMERIGFTGFADEHGFTHIQLGQQEDFER